MPGYEITQEMGPRACVVRLAGDIDIAVVPELRESLSSVLDSGCASIVLDLTDVRYADSTALGLLVWLDRRLRPAGGRLVLAGANRDITRILELSGLAAVAASVSTSVSLESALEGLDLSGTPGVPLWDTTIEAPPDADQLSHTRDRVAEILRPLHFPDSALFDIKVALGEALANSIRHGRPAHGETRIRVQVVAYDDRAVIEVMDNGPGFDGTHAGSDDVYAQSGRGVMFMKALMDAVEYDASPLGGTLVRMTKHRPSDHA